MNDAFPDCVENEVRIKSSYEPNIFLIFELVSLLSFPFRETSLPKSSK